MTTEIETIPQVVIIPPDPKKKKVGMKSDFKQLNVAAYCRVSTDTEEQLQSYDSQVKYYTDKIMKNPNWKFAGVYADEGITGRNTKKRDGFNAMIKACEQGKIDIIIAKSLSRFSRNTVDTLNYVRMLREKNITVIFEKENFDSSVMTDEMYITLMSMFAQAESESIGTAVAMGWRFKFKQGKVYYRYPIFGFDKGDDGKPVINEEQAETVRYIFRTFLEGKTVREIGKLLESKGIKTVNGSDKWSTSSLLNILKCEKYYGASIQQKTYVSNTITGKRIVNDGYLPKYLVLNAYPVIVEQQMFNAVQEELSRRNSKRNSSDKCLTQKGKFSKYALTGLVYCGECGTPYRRIVWSKRGKKTVVWRCVSRFEHGTRYCKESPTIKEIALKQAIIDAINRFVSGDDELLDMAKKSLKEVLTGNDTSMIDSLEYKISELKKMMIELVDLASKSGADEDKFDKEFEKISTEINTLQQELETEKCKTKFNNTSNPKFDNAISFIEEKGKQLNEFDDALVRSIIEKIIVLDKENIVITFKGGLEIRQELK